MKKIVIISIICVAFIIAGASAVYAKAPVGVDAAKENAVIFTGNSGADIEFQYEKNYDLGEYYVFRTGNGQVYVNKYTGAVERASFYDAVEPSGKIHIDSFEAEKIAEEYAVEKYSKFNEMYMELTDSQLLDHGDAGSEYSFIWRENLKGVLTPNSVAISINQKSGKITSYMGIHREINCPTKPKISNKEATAIATEQFPGIKIKEKESYLSIEYTKPDVQSLTWVITLKGEPVDNTLYGGTVIVDAVTGEVILKSPYC